MFVPAGELSRDSSSRLKMNLRTIKVSEETEKIGGITRKFENSYCETKDFLQLVMMLVN